MSLFYNYNENDDKLSEECGVFAIINSQNALYETAISLHSLQHRGQEGCGICYINAEGSITSEKSYGIVSQTLLCNQDLLSSPSDTAIGHVRYSTSGSKNVGDAQPFVKNIDGIDVALAHNGNIVNADTLRSDLISKGVSFATNIDSEIFLHLTDLSEGLLLEDKIKNACQSIKGGYSVVVATKDKIIGFRDRNGIRPLVCGSKIENGKKSYCFASENVAITSIGGKVEFEVKEGEIVVIDRIKEEFNITKTNLFKESEISRKFCVFEYIYFARPDSFIEQNSVYQIRKLLGQSLAKKVKDKNIIADIVVPVPDSGVPAAIGFSNQINLPFEVGLIRSHYAGRSFIAPTQSARDKKIILKHSVNQDVVRDKRLFLVDDSIVRGTTSKKIVKMLREFGAKEVHLIISSPPTIHPCYYGIDTPDEDCLLANVYNNDINKICEFLEADSLTYLAIEEVYGVIKTHSSDQFCDMCFTRKKVIF